MKQKPVVLIRDGLRLDFGRLEEQSEVSHYEIEVGCNIFGQRLYTERPVMKHRLILRMGDGIKTFKSEKELNLFLSYYGTAKVYSSDLIHHEVSL